LRNGGHTSAGDDAMLEAAGEEKVAVGGRVAEVPELRDPGLIVPLMRYDGRTADALGGEEEDGADHRAEDTSAALVRSIEVQWVTAAVGALVDPPLRPSSRFGLGEVLHCQGVRVCSTCSMALEGGPPRGWRKEKKRGVRS